MSFQEPIPMTTDVRNFIDTVISNSNDPDLLEIFKEDVVFTSAHFTKLVYSYIKYNELFQMENGVYNKKKFIMDKVLTELLKPTDNDAPLTWMNFQSYLSRASNHDTSNVNTI